MTKKKTTKKKKNLYKTNKDVDINDINAVFEDMKNLALDTSKLDLSETVEKEKEIFEELVNPKETEIDMSYSSDIGVIPSDSVDERGLPQAEEKIFFNEIEEMNIEEEQEEEVVEEQEEEGIFEMEEMDLTFVDEVKDNNEEIIEEKTQDTKKETKPRRISYEEMFGATWMGYGYTE